MSGNDKLVITFFDEAGNVSERHEHEVTDDMMATDEQITDMINLMGSGCDARTAAFLAKQEQPKCARHVDQW